MYVSYCVYIIYDVYLHNSAYKSINQEFVHCLCRQGPFAPAKSIRTSAGEHPSRSSCKICQSAVLTGKLLLSIQTGWLIGILITVYYNPHITG